jgi:hypothetical protein
VGDRAGSRSAIAALLLLAAGVGAAYAFSPLSVIFGVGMFLLFRHAVRGLPGGERRWVLAVLVTGVALRVFALIGIFITTDPWREQVNALFGDGHYSIVRSLRILNEWNGVPLGPWLRLSIFTAYGGLSYDRCLALVQWFVGPSPYGLTLISVAAFFGGTVLMYRVVRPSFGPVASLTAMGILVLWPTFFVWSISMLKESAQFFLSAAAISAAVWIARVKRWSTRAVLIVVIAAAVVLIAPLRGGSDLSVLGAVLLGYAVFASARHSAIFVALLLAVVVGGAAAGRRSAVQASIETRVALALLYHVGHVKTPGNAYRAADQRFYSSWKDHAAEPPTFDEGARFLLRSAAMFVLAPMPSQVRSTSEVSFLPQQMAWYLLVALACVGVWIGLRRDALLTGTCIGYCFAAAAIIAPYSGNIGTLVRHRDMVVPFVVWLSGLGVVGLLGSPGQKTLCL